MKINRKYLTLFLLIVILLAFAFNVKHFTSNNKNVVKTATCNIQFELFKRQYIPGSLVNQPFANIDYKIYYFDNFFTDVCSLDEFKKHASSQLVRKNDLVIIFYFNKGATIPDIYTKNMNTPKSYEAIWNSYVRCSYSNDKLKHNAYFVRYPDDSTVFDFCGL